MKRLFRMKPASSLAVLLLIGSHAMVATGGAEAVGTADVAKEKKIE
jgi:hypothetical protein